LLLVTTYLQLQETAGPESRELSRYLAKREEQARQEEELFTRAPITKRDKKLEKHLRVSRNGYAGSTLSLGTFFKSVSFKLEKVLLL